MTRHLSETERRNQILRSAREEFIQKGFENARMADVAKRAGLSKGAVYFYFKSKRELLHELVAHEHEVTYAFLDKMERDERPSVVKMLELGQAYLDYFAGLKTPPKFFVFVTELAIRDEAVRAESQAMHQRFLDAVTRLLAQGMMEGLIRPIDPESVALVLKAMIDGLAGQAAIGMRPDRDKLNAHGFGVILRGLLVDPSLADQLEAAP